MTDKHAPDKAVVSKRTVETATGSASRVTRLDLTPAGRTMLTTRVKDGICIGASCGTTDLAQAIADEVIAALSQASQQEQS